LTGRFDEKDKPIRLCAFFSYNSLCSEAYCRYSQNFWVFRCSWSHGTAGDLWPIFVTALQQRCWLSGSAKIQVL